MDTVYTTTITRAAQRRGVELRVLDSYLPIFELLQGGRRVRCFNALTDRVGAATFHLAQNKHAANRFLAHNGFPVPDQILFRDEHAARAFLKRHGVLVVKPCTQWGGRGVSMAVRTWDELRAAIRFARRYEQDVVLEECVRGEDQRLIMVEGRLAAAIRRRPAVVMGDGVHTVWQLIRRQNAVRRREDPSNIIPVNAETRRNMSELGVTPTRVPARGRRVQVRLTSNYHTGGTVDVITSCVAREWTAMARKVVKCFGLPVAGVDFLIDRRRAWIVEVSPDLAISPPEGEQVAERFLDSLFGR